MLKERFQKEDTFSTTAEIVNELAEQFDLVSPEDDTNEAEKKRVKDLLRKTIRRVAQRIPYDEEGSLWKATLKQEPEKEKAKELEEKAVRKSEKKGAEKEKHVFSIAQKRLLLDDIGLIRYLYKSSMCKDNEKLNQLKENAEEASKRNKEARRKVKCGEAEPWDLFDCYEPSEEQRTLELILVMVEALFLEKFEPIDKERFFSDLEIGSNKYGDEYTHEIIAAEKRLRNGVKAYVKRRTPKEDEDGSK